MKEKIQNKLYEMWLFREEAPKDSAIHAIRNAKLSGAMELAEELGFIVYFDPLAEGKNPFTVKEII